MSKLLKRNGYPLEEVEILSDEIKHYYERERFLPHDADIKDSIRSQVFNIIENDSDYIKSINISSNVLKEHSEYEAKECLVIMRSINVPVLYETYKDLRRHFDLARAYYQMMIDSQREYVIKYEENIKDGSEKFKVDKHDSFKIRIYQLSLSQAQIEFLSRSTVNKVIK